MMMDDHKVWKFNTLIDEYFAEWIYFGKTVAFNELPWSVQIEIKRLTSALNAFTNATYNAETIEGKQEIREAFEMGFNLQNKTCQDEQLQQLQALFSDGSELFSEFDERPRIADFYRHLFFVYQASYDYVTVFNDMPDDKYSDEFIIVNAFKLKNINTHIVEKCRTIYRAIKVPLGDMCEKSFTTSELIERYGYPDIDYEKLVEYNKQWCQSHGIKFKDYRKSRS